MKHPLFEDGTTVDIEEVRAAYRTENPDHIEQLNVFLGLVFKKADGTQMYERARQAT